MKFLIIVFVFLGSIIPSNAQRKTKIPTFNNIFTHKDKFYIITNDSTYETKDAVNWEVYPNKIDCKNIQLNYLNAGDVTYVFYASGGNFFIFDGKNFKQLYFFGEHRNQYGSFKFMYNNRVHLFGGYGLFTEKNIITFFDRKNDEWEIVECYNQYNEMPIPRTFPIAQVKGDELFVGFGEHKYLDDDDIVRDKNLSDVWKFSFSTKKWTYLGEKIEPHVRGKLIPFKNNQVIVFEPEKTYLVDLVRNKRINFPNHISNKFLGNIVYNALTDKFLIINKEKDGTQSIKVLSSKEVLGQKEETTPLYEAIDDKPKNIAIGLGIVVCLAVFSYYIILRTKRKLPMKVQIHNEFDKIMASLEGEEIDIFKTIWENYPKYVPYSDLMNYIDNKLSYDTQKKKLKMSLDEIDVKVQDILDIEYSIFEYSKSENDKRMKEVKIK